MPTSASEMGGWWPDPIDDIPYIPPKTWIGKLFDTPDKAWGRRRAELARRSWERTQEYHNDKCNVWHHDRYEYEYYNGLPLSSGERRPSFYIPSAEGVRCTCWRAKYTPEQWKAEQQKMAATLMEMARERRAQDERT